MGSILSLLDLENYLKNIKTEWLILPVQKIFLKKIIQKPNNLNDLNKSILKNLDINSDFDYFRINLL